MTESTEPIPAPRRIVTGVNQAGRSIVVSDGPLPPNATELEAGMGRGSDHWLVQALPADLSDTRDPLSGYTLKNWPAPGEIVFRMITWEPGFEFPVHRSNTLDIFFIISGQMELILEEGSTVVRAGDTVVQRGTSHGWKVVGNERCTAAGVLIDAAPRPGA